MAKRITALILAAILVALSLTACSGMENNDETTTNPAVIESETVIPEDTSTFKLSYTQSDSLNPFEAQTLNNQVLSQLVMVVFDVLSFDSFVGDKGDKMRLFLTDEGYQKALDNQERGFIKIKNHAKVHNGYLNYDHKDRDL